MVAAKRVAIIGSGVAGLCAARHCAAEEGVECVVFEKSSTIGGTWVYTDETHVDKNGLPVHSSMYRSLRTNLPKEAMSYPDYPHTNKEEVSYLPFTGVLNYLKDYATHFDLYKYIRFNQQVKRIHPIEENKWEVNVFDLETKEERTEYFDGIMICNGHNSIPRYPNTPGRDVFEGVQTHSHHYREPSPYKGQNVVVIGAGPSGLDLTCELAKVANKVYLSHHSDHAGKLQFSDNVVLKPDISHLTQKTVVFKDGSECDVDVIMYSTGYLVQYTFLTDECQVYVEDNFVKPLYHHLINIEHPTLCIMGLPKHLPVFHLCHIQSQFYIKTLTGKVKLPTKEEMHEELNNFIQKKLDEGVRMRDMMSLGNNMEKYYNDLANKAGVNKMPQLIVKMYNDAYERIYKDFMTFRNNCYRIIDNENFSVVDMRELEKSERSNNLCTPTCCRCRPLSERNI